MDTRAENHTPNILPTLPNQASNTSARDKANEHAKRAHDLAYYQYNLVEGIAEYIKAHRLGHPHALNEAHYQLMIYAEERPFYKVSKKELFQLLKDLFQESLKLDDPQKESYNDCENLKNAITFCQNILNGTSFLGARFWENGPINKASLTRGTLLAIGKYLKELLEQSKSKKDNPVKQIEHHIIEAKEELEKKQPDWTLALTRLNHALEISPLHSHAYFLRAKAYHRTQRNENALADINTYIQIENLETLTLTEEESEEKIRQSALAAQFSDQLELIDMLTEDLDEDDMKNRLQKKLREYRVIRAHRAKYLYENKKLIEALDETNKLLEIFPNDGYLFHMRGDIFLAKNDIHAAIKDYIVAANIYNAINSAPGTLRRQVYNALADILTASAETLAALSKKEIIAMLRTALSLRSSDALTICKTAIDPNTALGARLHKQSIGRSLFNTPATESNSVKEVKALFDAYQIIQGLMETWQSWYSTGKVYAEHNLIKEACNDFLMALKYNKFDATEYDDIVNILKNATPAALDDLSKKEILHLLSELRKHLPTEKQAELLQYAFQSDSNLCKRLNKSEGALFGLFATPDAGLQRAINNLKNAAVENNNKLKK